jgi:uncharacterized membrane protein
VLAPGDAAETFRHADDSAPQGRPVFVEFPNAAVYSPVPYLPSATAIRIGRGIGLSTLATLWLARLAGVTAYAALVALAVRRAPARRWLFAAFGVLPVALTQSATVSADTVTYALVLLVVAEAARLALTPGTLPATALGVAASATLALALAKQPYVLVAALLLVPAWRHRGRVAVGLALTLVVAAVLATAWSAWAREGYTAPSFAAAELDRDAYAYRDVDPDEQLRYVQDHPLQFFKIVSRTWTTHGGEIVPDVVAQQPAWRPPWWLALAAGAALVAAWRADPARAGGRAFAWTGLGVAAAVALAVLLLAYAGWNAVGAPRIDAFQGRYLLPALALAAIAALPVAQGRWSLPVDRRAGPAALAAEAVLAAGVLVGLARFWY